MNPRFTILALSALLLACETYAPAAILTNRLYYPTGIQLVERPGSTNGTLVVASANFDKRFASGWVTAIDLDSVKNDAGVGLPPFGTVPSEGLLQLTDLGTTQTIGISTFAGQMGMLPLASQRYRFVIPTRSEGMQVMGVDLAVTADGGVELSCFPGTPKGYERQCWRDAPTLVPAALLSTPTGVPRSPSPFGVGIGVRSCTVNDDCGTRASCNAGKCVTFLGDPFADIWITHIQQADSPYGSGLNYQGFAARLESDRLQLLDPSQFRYLGTSATSAVAVGQRWVYVSGRFGSGTTSLLELIDSKVADGGVIAAGLENTFAALDTRGVALNADESTLYIIARTPDVLFEVALGSTTTASPYIALGRTVPLCSGASEIKLLSRGPSADFLAITCSGAGVLMFYDQSAGQITGQILAVGAQPFGIAFRRYGAGARFFVSNFSDGQIAVIDVADLSRPWAGRIVAKIGRKQTCLSATVKTPECTGDDL